VEFYQDKIPLFHQYNIEEQLIQINSRRVDLASGGFLVIDQAEALVAIDVNSGKFRQPENAEQTALEINLEAAEEICRQLRLRDMGGVIVIDFIDMRMEKNKRAVEKKVRDALKNDRAKTKVLKMSAFGLLELTRQRMRPSRERSIYADCSHCGGSGQIKTPESVSLDAMRMIQLALCQDVVESLDVTVPLKVFEYLHNRRKRSFVHLEEDTGKKIVLRVGKELTPDAVVLKCFDGRNREVMLEGISTSSMVPLPERPSQANEPNEPRDSREPHDRRDQRDQHRDQREPRDLRDHRDQRGPQRGPRDSRGYRDRSFSQPQPALPQRSEPAPQTERSETGGPPTNEAVGNDTNRVSEVGTNNMPSGTPVSNENGTMAGEVKRSGSSRRRRRRRRRPSSQPSQEPSQPIQSVEETNPSSES
jgi:hypothetical protein